MKYQYNFNDEDKMINISKDDESSAVSIALSEFVCFAVSQIRLQEKCNDIYCTLSAREQEGDAVTVPLSGSSDHVRMNQRLEQKTNKTKTDLLLNAIKKNIKELASDKRDVRALLADHQVQVRLLEKNARFQEFLGLAYQKELLKKNWRAENVGQNFKSLLLEKIKQRVKIISSRAEKLSVELEICDRYGTELLKKNKSESVAFRNHVVGSFAFMINPGVVLIVSANQRPYVSLVNAANNDVVTCEKDFKEVQKYLTAFAPEIADLLSLDRGYDLAKNQAVSEALFIREMSVNRSLLPLEVSVERVSSVASASLSRASTPTSSVAFSNLSNSSVAGSRSVDASENRNFSLVLTRYNKYSVLMSHFVSSDSNSKKRDDEVKLKVMAPRVLGGDRFLRFSVSADFFSQFEKAYRQQQKRSLISFITSGFRRIFGVDAVAQVARKEGLANKMSFLLSHVKENPDGNAAKAMYALIDEKVGFVVQENLKKAESLIKSNAVDDDRVAFEAKARADAEVKKAALKVRDITDVDHLIGKFAGEAVSDSLGNSEREGALKPGSSVSASLSGDGASAAEGSGLEGQSPASGSASQRSVGSGSVEKGDSRSPDSERDATSLDAKLNSSFGFPSCASEVDIKAKRKEARQELIVNLEKALEPVWKAVKNDDRNLTGETGNGPMYYINVESSLSTTSYTLVIHDDRVKKILENPLKCTAAGDELHDELSAKHDWVVAMAGLYRQFDQVRQLSGGSGSTQTEERYLRKVDDLVKMVGELTSDEVLTKDVLKNVSRACSPYQVMEPVSTALSTPSSTF